MRLFQIPFSHNCVKVRRALDLKGLDYETVNINPAVRRAVKRASGQELVPVLVDSGHAIAGSTQILLDVEERHPDPPLLPADERDRAECVVLMHWADAAFMDLTRRMAYFRVLSGTGADLGKLFFPGWPAALQRAGGAASTMVLRRRFGITEEQNRLDLESAAGRRVSRSTAWTARSIWWPGSSRSPTSRSRRWPRHFSTPRWRTTPPSRTCSTGRTASWATTSPRARSARPSPSLVCARGPLDDRRLPVRRRALRADGARQSAGYCHCTRCQRRTGCGASAQARIDGRTFRIVRGEELVKCWRHPDGGFEKCFCPQCGSHLFSRNPDDHTPDERAPRRVRRRPRSSAELARSSSRTRHAWEPSLTTGSSASTRAPGRASQACAGGAGRVGLACSRPWRPPPSTRSRRTG